MRESFRTKLKSGQPQLGMWLSLGAPTVADLCRDIGFDWCLIDMEHTPNEVSDVRHQMYALSQGPAATLVRPPWNDTVLVKRLLDAGLDSFIFPMVNSAEEAAAAVAATRYPPEGVRGVSMTHSANRFGRRKDYLDKVADEIAVIVQIETETALARVADIAAVPGVDGVFFGPADIAASLGVIGALEDPKVWDAIYSAAETAQALGTPVGTLTGSPDRIREALGRGFQFIACGTDLTLLSRSLTTQLQDVRGTS
ncbi:MAG: aldolase/citrate lyase family protein [Pseudomonadota bacterium]